jgi:hypothetical protein
MDTGVGASFVLSFLVVGVAAIALRPNRESKTPSPSASTIPTAPASSPAVRPSLADHPLSPQTTPRPTSRTGLSRKEAGTDGHSPPVRTTAHTVVQEAVPARTGPAARRNVDNGAGTGRRPAGRRPRDPFTDVESGESLDDVALRIYGSTEAAKALWIANRDQVESPNAPLRAGMLLRTP